jgi:ligand-binding sensor domain-containing protein/signal transduction histidine kinase
MKEQNLSLNYQFKLSFKMTGTSIFWKLKVLLPLLLLAACTGSPKDDGTSPPSLYQQPKTIPANPKGGYAINPVTGDSIQPIVNSLGDTLITGVPIPTQGKRIHPDSVAKPKVINTPPLSSLKKYNAQPNRFKVPDNLPTFPVDESKLTKILVPQVAKGDTAHYILNGFGQKVLTGVPIPATGKKVSITHPQPTQALPMAMKDGAVANIQYLDAEQGMASSLVRGIAEDKNGHLWFGTDAGLSKYDGQSFTHFTKKEGFISSRVLSIAEDKNGNIWFGTDGSGVIKYDGNTFTHFTEKDGLSSNNISSIAEDKNGNIWFGTARGVSKYDGKTFTHFTQKEGLSDNRVTSIKEDKNGHLWFGTPAGGVNKYDAQTFTHFTEKDGLSSNNISSIAEDKNGHLWFGTYGGGVNKYDKKSFTHFTEKEGLSKNEVTSIAKDKNGHLWFGTDLGGVSKYDGQSFTHFTKKEGLSNNTVRKIAVDRNGNLWFSTFGGGVSKYNGQSFARYAENEGLSNNTVFTMAEDKSGNLWFGTTGGGVSKYDGKSFTHFTEKEGLNNNSIRSSLADKKGNLWFGTGGDGVCKYDGHSFTHFTVKEGLSSNYVESIAEDKNGNLWFGTVGGGVSKYDGKSFTHFAEKEGLSSNSVPSILEDKNGHLWFGTSVGVSKYDGKSFTHFTQKEGLSSNTVLSILEDKNGHLWFGTAGGGVSKYDGKSFTHFTKKEGLSYNSVPSIAEDKNGYLWFGTYGGGVNKYDGKFLSAGQAGLTHFARKEGLSHNSVRKVLVDKNGHLWLGTWDGVNKLEKDAYQPSPYPLVVHLRQLYINEALPNYRNPLDSSIEDIQFDSVQVFENYPIHPRIPFDQNHLGFQFSAIDWSAPTKIKYSFRLLGLDNKWSNPSEKTLADYRNLPHGKFTFQVRAIGESGEWSKSFDYLFTILPPWWLTWWAYTFYALLFLGALRTFSLWRERNLLKEKEQLKQKVEERTSELKKSLEDLKSTQSQLIQSEKMASLGELTAGIAHEIQNPLNFVNNFSEVSNELIDEMREELAVGNNQLANEIADDIKQNLEKINHHGKRAADIVKGMLQHSRTSSGQKEPTDINALADEYLRLAYHGLRAKDKSFNAEYKTDFDPNLPKINVVPQDIGRVLLNLINNAFYAVDKKAKNMTPPPPKGGIKSDQNEYRPTVTICTTSFIPPLGGARGVRITVKDNGDGIPAHIVDKIFQPFFTTKPTGQGTGLGLSLSYDIVKAHGGEIKVQTKEGEGSIFNIQIPIN